MKYYLSGVAILALLFMSLDLSAQGGPVTFDPNNEQSISFEVITDTCPGDFGGDGFVNAGDILPLLGAYATTVQEIDPCDADLDDNLVVDILDLVEFLRYWNLPCP